MLISSLSPSGMRPSACSRTPPNPNLVQVWLTNAALVAYVKGVAQRRQLRPLHALTVPGPTLSCGVHCSDDPFWRNVAVGADNTCWLWLGPKVGGYGIHLEAGKRRRAHRVAWELTYGPVPAGQVVAHFCGNAACCNPDHMFTGTPGDVAGRGASRGRCRTKLRKEQVVDIRRRYRGGGVTLAALAEEFGVSPSVLSRIIRGKRWDWVDP